MNLLQAVILGLIQGLSEFIPISSTAHLTIAGSLFGLIDNIHPEHWTAFIATVQLGTLFAVLMYFYRELYSIPKAFFDENFSRNRKPLRKQSVESRLGLMIILGSVPMVIIGLLLKKLVEGHLTKNPVIIACSMVGLALILALAERTAKFDKQLDKITLFDSIIIGLAQCLALIPGASRSGTTITAGLFLGVKREAAARFSFLLSIPAVLGSGIYEFYKSLQYIESTELLNLLIAVIVSAVSGYASIHFLLMFLKTKSTMLFVYYRIIFGIVIIFLFSRGII